MEGITFSTSGSLKPCPSLIIFNILITVGLVSTFTLAASDNWRFQVKWGDGNATEFSYPQSVYSDCLYDPSLDTLTCDHNHGHYDVMQKLTYDPGQINYLSVRCLSQIHHDTEKHSCFCRKNIDLNRKSSSSGSSSSPLPSSTSPTFDESSSLLQTPFQDKDSSLFSSTSSSTPSSTASIDNDYSLCQLYRLNPDMLKGYNSLEVLDLADNLISNIHSQTFQNLTSLRVLSLHNNPLLDLHRTWGCLPDNLEILDLSLSDMQTFPAAFLRRCQANSTNRQLAVTYLDISRSRMKGFLTYAFMGFGNLRFCNMSNGRISQLPPNPFEGAISLRTVDLSNNKLENIPVSFCQGTPYLEYLHVSSNLLSTVAFDHLSDCANLKRLDVSKNAIATLDTIPSTLNNLQVFFMSENRLVNINQPLVSENSSIKFIDLTNNNIKKIHENALVNATNLRTLILRHNALNESVTNLKIITINCVYLRYLDMSRNLFTTLGGSFLSELNALEELNFSSNLIENIHMHAFRGLGSLRRLSLASNLLSFLVPDLFTDLPSLMELDLSGNMLTANTGEFSIPLSLVKLDLSINHYVTIPKFNMTYLTHVILTHNMITSIAQADLQHLQDVTELDLSYNLISDSSIKHNAFHHLHSLTKLHLAHNGITSLAKNTISMLSNLEYFDIGFNNLTSLGHIELPKSLKVMIATNNKLESITEPMNSRNLSDMRLTKLVLSRCEITSISADAFVNLPHMEEIDLRDNRLSTFPAFNGGNSTAYLLQGNPLECTCDLAWLKSENADGIDQGSRPTYEIDFCALPPKNYSVPFKDVPRHYFLCEVLNSCPSSCSCFAQNRSSESEVVMCNGRNFSSIPPDLPRNAKVIAFDGNDFGDVDLDTIHAEELSVQELYLNASNIYNLNASFFDNTPSLTLLDISDNFLDSINQSWLDSLRNLTVLSVKNNHIGSLPLNIFNNYNHIQVINLSSNRLRYLEDEIVITFRNMPKLTSLYLGNNPWHCDCGNLGMMTWLREQHRFDLQRQVEREKEPHLRRDVFVKTGDSLGLKSQHLVVQDLHEIICDNEKTTTVMHFDFSDLDCDGSQYRMKIKVLIVCIAVFIIICLISFCFYHRKLLAAILYTRLNLVCMKDRTSLNQHLRLSGPFDITLIYDVHDRKLGWWVDFILMPKLHRPNWRFSVKCPTKDDIDQGMSHMDMSIHNVNRSRCSLLIVTSNFVYNQQCLSCFKQAVQQRRSGLHSIVVITWGELTRDTLDTGIRSFVNKGLNLPITAHLFWDRLFYQLPIPRHRKLTRITSFVGNFRSSYNDDSELYKARMLQSDAGSSLSSKI